mmetsp:Transcript_27339/g.90873  ORF Transcript_27339/g.90873 Transcript_27339/m.90873 type:complete len:229 (+) Transcript_27339:60-746(+)
MASTLRCRGPEGRQRARSQIIVMGMSRSGSSLTTSIIAAMLRNGSRSDETAWRGHGRALPSDSANPGGYYEREDVVRLNYATISSVTGAGWTSFRPDHLLRPAALNASWRAPSGRARCSRTSASLARCPSGGRCCAALSASSRTATPARLPPPRGSARCDSGRSTSCRLSLRRGRLAARRCSSRSGDGSRPCPRATKRGSCTASCTAARSRASSRLSTRRRRSGCSPL